MEVHGVGAPRGYLEWPALEASSWHATSSLHVKVVLLYTPSPPVTASIFAAKQFLKPGARCTAMHCDALRCTAAHGTAPQTFSNSAAKAFPLDRDEGGVWRCRGSKRRGSKLWFRALCCSALLSLTPLQGPSRPVLKIGEMPLA